MNKQILRLAIPSILANITIPLVGLVDTAIVGHISSAVAIGGIAIGTMLFDLLYWNFGFLRVATSGNTAQAFGQGNHKECMRLLTRSLTISILSALVLWAIQWLFVTAVLAITPCSVEVADFARCYFYVRIWAAPATLALMAFKGWFIGMQDTISPMVCDIVVNVVNMVASYYLAVCTPLGAVGVAHGTLIAQYTGLIIAVVLLLTRYRRYLPLVHFSWSDIRGKDSKQLAQLDARIIVRSLCFMVVYVGYTAIASSYGDTELAVSSIVMKLFMLFSYFADGFAYAAEALVGRFIGEKNPEKLRLSIRLLIMWSLTVGGLFTIVYAVCGLDSIRLITSDVNVICASQPYLPWIIAMPIVSVLAFMWDGVFIGATDGIAVRNSMIWAALGFLLGYLALYRWLGIQALYTAYFIHLIARVVYFFIRWRSIHLVQSIESC